MKGGLLLGLFVYFWSTIPGKYHSFGWCTALLLFLAAFLTAIYDESKA